LLLAVFSFIKLNAQAQNPVSWTAAYKSVSSTEGEIILTANIEKGWHTYSQQPSDAGLIPTSFTFAPSSQYQLVGKPSETGAREEFDKAFGAKVTVINDKAEFHQKVKLNGKTGFTVNIKAEYMCCNDMMCLPPKTVDLSVKIQ
jgi:thiol:disulfide interchange protein DsbD